MFGWAAAGVLLAADFSHQLHLKLVPRCTQCHTRASTSTQPSDNLLPPASACQPCHESREIRAPRQSFVTQFSHAQHAQLGNFAPLIAAAIDKKTYLSPPGDTRRHLDQAKQPCESCHRGLRESARVDASHRAQMADCLVCHVKIEMTDSCLTCHAPGQEWKPANHVAGFLDVHTRKNAGLDKTSCAVCHGRTFTCLGCH